jgi:hypothetical protein
VALPHFVWSCSQKNSLAEEIELGTAIHLAFQEFQTRHLSLTLSIAPRQVQCCFDRLIVCLDAKSEGYEHPDLTLAALGQTSQASKLVLVLVRTMPMKAVIASCTVATSGSYRTRATTAHSSASSSCGLRQRSYANRFAPGSTFPGQPLSVPKPTEPGLPCGDHA